jgi:hypothetical protein
MTTAQYPFVQGIPLQQSEATLHCWPYVAQLIGVPASPAVMPPSPEEPPAPPLPPLPPIGGGVLGAQAPRFEPGVAAQLVPGQQSALVEQAPPLATHLVAPQTKGGMAPDGLGTQGMLQQSALEAHAVPAGGGPLAAQS